MIPRKEFPNPQFERENWRNLNGEWDFLIDMSVTGKQRRFYSVSCKEFRKKITVPFCPESRLSGIQNIDFMNAVWYRRKFDISPEEKEKRTIIHIGASDFQTEVFVNGHSAGIHCGGYVSFEFDITELVNVGENIITIFVIDDTRSNTQPTGKQSTKYASHKCVYTRTTGIWQTVWLEFVPKNYIKSFKIVTNTDDSVVHISGDICGKGKVKAVTSFDGKDTGSAETTASGYFNMTVPLSELHLWEIGVGGLYDLILTLEADGETDKVKSYFGMRSIGFDGMKFMFNGRSVFQRLVLDQGFYPDGIYTAPTEEDLIRDIKLSMDAGFNGARLHQKVFEPRFLYHCDRLGYIVWGEHASWAYDYDNKDHHNYFLDEWMEILIRDRNHPAIIAWCPFNELWDPSSPRWEKCITSVYNVTKALDPTRPFIDSSGGRHLPLTEIFDTHDYDRRAHRLRERYCNDTEWDFSSDLYSNQRDHMNPLAYHGQPVMNSEFGGLALHTTEGGFGYGDSFTDPDEYIETYCSIVKTLLDSPRMCGFCYTQLTDVEQEQNGIYFYNREKKCDLTKIREANMTKAKIEE